MPCGGGIQQVVDNDIGPIGGPAFAPQLAATVRAIVISFHKRRRTTAKPSASCVDLTAMPGNQRY